MKSHPQYPLTYSYWLNRGWADAVSLSQQSRLSGSLQFSHPFKEGYSHLNPGEAASGSMTMPGKSKGCWENLSEAGVKDRKLSKAFEQSLKKPIIYVFSSLGCKTSGEQV